MRVQQAEEREHEANLRAARAQEAMEGRGRRENENQRFFFFNNVVLFLDAVRQKEEALESVEKLMAERQELRRLVAKTTGERDFFEWLGLHQSTHVVDWIEPGEPQWEPVSRDGWHENVLFGVQNALYESP
jgi:hypothetical protein